MADVLHNRGHRRTGSEKLAHADLFQFLDVFVGHNAAAGEEHIVQAALAQQFQDAREDRHVRAGEHGNANDIHVLLQRGFRDHFGRLAQTGVDHFHSRIAQSCSNNFRATIVAIQSGFGNKDSYFSQVWESAKYW